MNRLKACILIFLITLSIPLSYVIWRTYAGLEREEWSQLRFFADTLFDAMEEELGEMVQREEGRAVDEYNHSMLTEENRPKPSPLALAPKEPYILGYLQNNPDGTMQSPLVADPDRVPGSQQAVVDRLKEINRRFNQKKYDLPPGSPAPKPLPEAEAQVLKEEKGFADRYVTASKSKKAKDYLGQQSVRIEKISPQQAANIASEERVAKQAEADDAVDGESVQKAKRALNPDWLGSTRRSADEPAAGAPPAPVAAAASTPDRFQVEVAPLQSLFIDAETLFVFRRVVIGNQVYRQGFVLALAPLSRRLAEKHFSAQPLAAFTRLRLTAPFQGNPNELVAAGSGTHLDRTVAARTFPAPFNCINATVVGGRLPVSATRQAMNIALGALGAVMLIGLFAIYQSTRAVVALSERRSQFVSSVTHELKTPLTNIRMYVEMLEQGIAATPEREQAYLGIIGSESARLSRLINNVLELAKLEKKQRHLDMQAGQLDEVLAEVRSVMAPKLAQEGFELTLPAEALAAFEYDREAMIQILLNLVENSIKFGRSEPVKRITITARRQQDRVEIAVTDTGPGIPRQALSKIFDDFYRADNALTRTAGGTGIGLALVKKLVQAMGGRVQAANNEGPGCTITLYFPPGS